MEIYHHIIKIYNLFFFFSFLAAPAALLKNVIHNLIIEKIPLLLCVCSIRLRFKNEISTMY